MGLLATTRAQSENYATTEDLSIFGRFQDRIVINDPDLARFLGDRVREPNEAIPKPWVSVAEAWRLSEAMGSWKWDEPDWFSTLTDESRWAEDAYRSDGKVAWMHGKNLIIQAPYTLTLADSLTPPTISSPYRFSNVLKGWIIEKVEQDAQDLRSILQTYDISLSPEASAALEGRRDWRATLENSRALAEAEGFVLPGPFESGRTYKPHQELAVMTLAKNGGGLLADQVGLGKGGEFTGGALALDQFIRNVVGDTLGAYPVVVSVTSSMKEEIPEEILKWKHDAKIEILYGRAPSPINKDSEFIILNHDILQARLPDIMEAGPVGFIADECHVFKNPGALRTKAALELAKFVREQTDRPYITMASGTPFLNSPIELWPILGILGKQSEFGEYARAKLGTTHTQIYTRNGRKKVPLSDSRAFEMRWCDAKYDRFKHWVNDGASNTAELNSLLIQHGMIRRKKSDVMHPLPPLKEHIVLLEPEQAEMDEYRYVEQQFREWLIEEVRANPEIYDAPSPEKAVKIALAKLFKGQAIMKLTALRQACAQIKVNGTVDWIVNFLEGRQQVEHLDGHIGPVSDDPSRRKLIVFAHHREPRQAIIEHPLLAGYDIRTILSAGDHKAGEIQQNKRDFQQDPDVRLLVCSMAAKEGHTLTAAKDVYLHELPWLPPWIIQMAGRCWARISEEYDPHEAWIHYAIARNTYDSVLVKKNKIKKSIFNAVIDGEGQDADTDEITEESAESLLDALAIGKRELGIAV